MYNTKQINNCHNSVSLSFLEIAKGRVAIALTSFLFVFIVVIFRINFLVFQGDDSTVTAFSSDKSAFYRNRMDIVDRNGTLLATNITTSSLYADARKITNPQAIAKSLCSLLPNISFKQLVNKLSSNKRFVWVARHLTPAQKDKILHAGLPALNFVKDVKRMYVHGNLNSHVLGLTNIDNNGVSGIEKFYDVALQSSGGVLQLSIDARIQHSIRDVLLSGIKEFNATGAAAIVMNIENAEILGMVSLPDYDPNHSIQLQSDFLFNRATSGMYEMGSTLKIINTAMVLDSGSAELTTVFNTSPILRIGKYTITDYRANYGKINVAEIFVNSSNKGSALMLLQAGGEKQREFLAKIGCLSKINIELPEIGAPLLPSKWSDASSMTISYGYGLGISPVHLLNSVATIIGGGCKKNATLIKGKNNSVTCNRVISKATSSTMKKLMHFVVTNGHSKKARVPGYFVSGKTGTRNMLVNGKYVNNRVSTTFVGAIGNDMEHPKYMVVVLLEDPKATKNTMGFTAAGWNAAPIGGKILSRVASVTGLKPATENYLPNFKEFLRDISY